MVQPVAPITPRRGQFTPGAVRTATPFLVGWLVTWAARQGFDINDDNAAYLIGAVGGYVFWAIVRFLEVFSSAKWSYVLGLGVASTAPVYGVEVDRPVEDVVPPGA